jgi:hypothetical protein
MGDAVLEIHSDIFPHTPAKLGRLVDPKNPDLLKELGGVEGMNASPCVSFFIYFSMSECWCIFVHSNMGIYQP